MAHYRDHMGRECRCWACGRVIEEPIRGLCFECYTQLRQPGRMGPALLDGPASVPPFLTLSLEAEPRAARRSDTTT
jgi:hypothetical protein